MELAQRWLPIGVLAAAIVASLTFGKTISVWPLPAKAFAGRRTEPMPYWVSIGLWCFGLAVATFSAFTTPAHPPQRTLSTDPVFGVMMVIVIGLNVAYYWLKGRSVSRAARLAIFFPGILLLITSVWAPEIFSGQLPYPWWKVFPIVGFAAVGSLGLAGSPPAVTQF
jgi:hypothetical protein